MLVDQDRFLSQLYLNTIYSICIIIWLKSPLSYCIKILGINITKNLFWLLHVSEISRQSLVFMRTLELLNILSIKIGKVTELMLSISDYMLNIYIIVLK